MFSVTFSPIRRLSNMWRSDKASPRLSTCGRNVCLREKAKRWRTRPAARLAFWRICMMSWKDGSVGLWAFTRKSVAIMMAPSTLLKSCAMPPASLPTSSIFWDWVNWLSSVRCSVVSMP